MKLLSLFSGIGAFEEALKRLNIEFETVGISEIDKYTIKSYYAIHGACRNFGSVTDINTSELPSDIDLITYGFPCQDISLAGKQRGFEHEGEKTRSGLFFEALRIIEDTKPKFAIAENVKNLVSKKFKNEFQIVLDSLEKAGYNNYWKVLNAKDFGIPQNRERVFIISIRKDVDDGTFEFPEGFELKLRLKDMLEDQVDEKYYINKKWHFSTDEDEKHDSNEIAQIEGFSYKATRSITDVNKICRTLDTMGGGQREPKIIDGGVIIPEATRKGYAIAEEGDGVYINRPHQKRGCVQKGMIQTLKTSSNDVGVVTKQLRIRKLTPKECWRLMGFTDEDFEKAELVNSNTQLYKQAGNSIVVNVLVEIFKKLYKK